MLRARGSRNLSCCGDRRSPEPSRTASYNRRMRPVFTFLLLACACAAQDSKPPAEVDAALRERVDQFFRYHVSAQFRKAEALTAEDSKDFFYNAPKPHYLSYGGIQTIRYSDNFTHAYVTVTVQTASSAEFGNVPALPIPSMWKVEDGKW